MASPSPTDLIIRRYRDAFDAAARPLFGQWLAAGSGAALGYARAGAAPLFLESYLDEPIEVAAARALGRPVRRDAIVEIGNFAADSAMAMIALWGSAANDLGGASEVAVATLTASLRAMFARVGVPIVHIARADAARLGDAARLWGRYYDQDPLVCAGEIARGQAAIAAFMARRARSRAA